MTEFERYVTSVEPSIERAAGGKTSVPWLEGEAVQKVSRGDVVVRSFTGDSAREIADGLVHDWAGSILIRDAQLDQVLTVLRDFDRHKQWYPEVVDSKLLSAGEDHTRGWWLLRRKKIITVVLSAELHSTYAKVAPERWFVRSTIATIREARESDNRNAGEYPAGEGHGFLWRLTSYWSLQQAPEGVYASLRVISLSRRVPSGLGWIVNPFIKSMPMESVKSSLENTRKAVGGLAAKRASTAR